MESDKSVNMFKNNGMFENPDRIQTMVVRSIKNTNKRQSRNINNTKIESANYVTSLRMR